MVERKMLKIFDEKKIESEIVITPPKSISDQIYESLKERILVNIIPQGQRLIENDVASLYRASRTPIREAFRRLEQDGLVERIPQGGLRVTEISAQEIREIYGIRMVLEAYVGELACDNITTELIQKLKDISSQARQFLPSSEGSSPENLVELWKLNTLFHDTIYQATESQYLIRMLNTIRDMLLRVRILTLKTAKAEKWKEHEKIINLLESRDKIGLSKLMKQHIQRSAEAALETLRTVD
jgi:DNA-binding GntR family transcriptional regulator